MKIYSLIAILFGIINNKSVNGFFLNNLPVKIVNPIQFTSINNELLETTDLNNKNIFNRSIVFFPIETNNNLPIKLYNNFLNSFLDKKLNVYAPTDNNNQNFLNDFKENNDTITVVAHSNSAIKAIEYSNNNPFVNNLVLIDPLDLRSNNDKTEDIIELTDINSINKNKKKSLIKLNNINNLLIINSKKSNDWRLLPITFPIGFFSLKMTDLKISKNITKDIIKANYFGHFDIMDEGWSNFMHSTLSVGLNDRDSVKLEQYHTWLANKISDVVE